MGLDGRPVRVESVSAPRRGLVTLYNIEVEVSHAYFVSGGPPGASAPGILVHNGYNCFRLPAHERELIAAERLSVRSARGIGAAGVDDIHHIATRYEGKSNWATRFKGIFAKAGYSLDDAINKVAVPGHFGGHPERYHAIIFRELTRATKGLEGPAYRAAFEARMMVLRGRVTDVTDVLNKLITR